MNPAGFLLLLGGSLIGQSFFYRSEKNRIMTKKYTKFILSVLCLLCLYYDGYWNIRCKMEIILNCFLSTKHVAKYLQRFAGGLILKNVKNL